MREHHVLYIQKNGLQPPERQPLKQGLAEVHGVLGACVCVGAAGQCWRELVDVASEDHGFAAEAHAGDKYHGLNQLRTCQTANCTPEQLNLDPKPPKLNPKPNTNNQKPQLNLGGFIHNNNIELLIVHNALGQTGASATHNSRLF